MLGDPQEKTDPREVLELRKIRPNMLTREHGMLGEMAVTSATAIMDDPCVREENA